MLSHRGLFSESAKSTGKEQLAHDNVCRDLRTLVFMNEPESIIPREYKRVDESLEVVNWHRRRVPLYRRLEGAGPPNQNSTILLQNLADLRLGEED